MASVNTLCKSVPNVKNTVIKIAIFTLIRMELNISVSKQDPINGTRTTAHSAINHALFMINIPDQLSERGLTGVSSSGRS